MGVVTRDKKIYWGDLSWVEHEQYKDEGAVVILPIGAIEQHGPHLPTKTDAFLVSRVAEQAAIEIEEFPVLITPTVWAGFSPTHRNFNGTLTLRLSVFLDVLLDLCRSIRRSGYTKLLLLNGHGGNAGAIRSLVLGLVEDGIYPVTVEYFSLIGDALKTICESEHGGVCHACEMETSLMLHCAPGLVNMTRAVRELDLPFSSYVGHDFRYPKPAMYAPDFGRYTEAGVAGDPTLASAQKGEQLFNAAVAELKGLIRYYKDLRLGESFGPARR